MIMHNRRFRGWTFYLTLGLISATWVQAAEPPIEINWAQLVPAAGLAKPAKPLWLQGAKPAGGEQSQPAHETAEGRWLSSRPQSEARPPAVVTALDGKRVHIGGYVVPLDFDATKIKEFLLVPYVGACIHVPPPPANQIIYVKAERAFDIKGQFDPVYVTGILKTASTSTGLADAGYTLEAETVDPRKN